MASARRLCSLASRSPNQACVTCAATLRRAPADRCRGSHVGRRRVNGRRELAPQVDLPGEVEARVPLIEGRGERPGGSRDRQTDEDVLLAGVGGVRVELRSAPSERSSPASGCPQPLCARGEILVVDQRLAHEPIKDLVLESYRTERPRGIHRSRPVRPTPRGAHHASERPARAAPRPDGARRRRLRGGRRRWRGAPGDPGLGPWGSGGGLSTSRGEARALWVENGASPALQAGRRADRENIRTIPRAGCAECPFDAADEAISHDSSLIVLALTSGEHFGRSTISPPTRSPGGARRSTWRPSARSPSVSTTRARDAVRAFVALGARMGGTKSGERSAPLLGTFAEIGLPTSRHLARKTWCHEETSWSLRVRIDDQDSYPIQRARPLGFSPAGSGSHPDTGERPGSALLVSRFRGTRRKGTPPALVLDDGRTSFDGAWPTCGPHPRPPREVHGLRHLQAGGLCFGPPSPRVRRSRWTGS